MKHIAVIGAGMRGITGAILLRKAGYDVTLIEAAELPGGILLSKEWEGLYVDKGCHILDFSHEGSAQLYKEILTDKLHPVERRYRSINRGIASIDIAVPDMSRFPEYEQAAAIDSLLGRDIGTERSPTLKTFFNERYGNIAGDYIAECTRKMTGVDPHTLAPEAFALTPLMSRIRIGSDKKMRILKKNRELSDILAASNVSDVNELSSNNSMPFHRNYYPSERGMRGFCEAAAEYLRKIGISTNLSEVINAIRPYGHGLEISTQSEKVFRADMCYWSIPPAIFLNLIGQSNPTANFVTPWSMLIYAFKTDPAAISDILYSHDYSNQNLCFRGSTPGKYGRQTDLAGQTYVCAEVPAQTKSVPWRSAEENTDRVWSELKNMAIVDKSASYSGHRVEKLPVVLMLPKNGWYSADKALNSLLASYSPNIRFGNNSLLGKSAIVESVSRDLEDLI